MSPTRTITDRDRRLTEAFLDKGRAFLQLPEDERRIQRILGSGRPAERLADMASRGQVARVARGTYVFLPQGSAGVGQIKRSVLVAAALENRWSYYVGFASAIVEHGLTDEIVDELTVAVEGRTVPAAADLAGVPLRVVRMAYDDDERTGWIGVQRPRARAQTMYWLAGIERTLVDALDRPHMCVSTELWVRAWERALREDRVDVGLLLDLARRRSKAVSARAALLLREAGRIRESRLLLNKPVSGRVLFDASAPPSGKVARDRSTGLMLNVSLDAISGWMAYGK